MCGCGRAFSLSLSPSRRPAPSFEAPVAMTQQESQTCSSACWSPPSPHTHTPPAPCQASPSLGHPRGKPEARILDPSQRTQSGERGGLKAQPPLLRGGMTFLARDPGGRTESGPLATGPGVGRPWGWKSCAPPAALHLKGPADRSSGMWLPAHIISEVLVSLPCKMSLESC